MYDHAYIAQEMIGGYALLVKKIAKEGIYVFFASTTY